MVLREGEEEVETGLEGLEDLQGCPLLIGQPTPEVLPRENITGYLFVRHSSIESDILYILR